MFSPAQIYLQQYRECREKQAELRKSLGCPKDENEEHKFCSEFYKLYIAKLVTDLL